MKALISPNESFTLSWISSWNGDIPVYSEILNCQRVAQVELDNKVFQVAQPMYWVDCPDNCLSDQWYFKDGQVLVKPQDAEKLQG
jgi:hypothetical protein